LTCVAIIVGAHGVHGAVKVKSFTQNPADFSIYGPLLGADGQVVLTPKNPRPMAVMGRAPSRPDEDATDATETD